VYKIHIAWHISPTGPISARMVPYQPEWPHISPRACILFIIYCQAKIVVRNELFNEDKMTIDLFVMLYFSIVTLLICIFCMRADIDMHFLHGMQIWVTVTSPMSCTPCKFCTITTKYMIKQHIHTSAPAVIIGNK
jgi:hypothetical protein